MELTANMTVTPPGAQTQALSPGSLGTDTSNDVVWILTSTFIIFTMQSGFGLLESGSVATKNEVNIMVKNAIDVIVGGFSYWAFGYAISFGDERLSNPFCGWGYFFVEVEESMIGEVYAKFFFKASFATTASTIVSGAMAERTKLEAYIMFSLFNPLIFCLPAHWVWDSCGWLRQMGFIDVAGDGPVHLVGGVTGLVATLLLQPRHGRFHDNTAADDGKKEGVLDGKPAGETCNSPVNSVSKQSIPLDAGVGLTGQPGCCGGHVTGKQLSDWSMYPPKEKAPPVEDVANRGASSSVEGTTCCGRKWRCRREGEAEVDGSRKTKRGLFQFWTRRRQKAPPPMGSPTNALLGMFMLWWGWLGFNCGSTFGVSGSKWKLAARSAVSTLCSSMGGGIVGLLISYIFKRRKIDVPTLINGVLGSLVSITGLCALARPWEGFLIGAVGAILVLLAIETLDRLQVDDPVGCVGVHAVGGTWGLIAGGLFARSNDMREVIYLKADPDGLLWGGGAYLLGIQVMGITVIAAWTTITSFAVLKLISITIGLRMSMHHEILGADLIEHAVSEAYFDKVTNKVIHPTAATRTSSISFSTSGSGIYRRNLDNPEMAMTSQNCVPQFNETRKRRCDLRNKDGVRRASLAEGYAEWEETDDKRKPPPVAKVWSDCLGPHSRTESASGPHKGPVRRQRFCRRSRSLSFRYSPRVKGQRRPLFIPHSSRNITAGRALDGCDNLAYKDITDEMSGEQSHDIHVIASGVVQPQEQPANMDGERITVYV